MATPITRPDRTLLTTTADHLEAMAGTRPSWPPTSYRQYARWLRLTYMATRLRAIAAGRR
jgi:hypothetical protein